ncbi:MAG: VCBS repeat-containing protein, partial [Magnetococcales bacterium]|nr:VCBS repeat-containing protein [Magnetococcales bacterium]
GRLDIVCANEGGSDVSVLLGQVSGGFANAINYTVGSRPYSVISADFNGDGRLDIASANWDSDNVSVLLGQASGGFTQATSYAVGDDPRSVTSADFNGDGLLDIACANRDSNNVSLLLSQASGGFATAVNYAVGSSPHSVASADFNGDGLLDIASANYDGNNVSVLLNTTSGGFAPPQPTGIDLAAADDNGLSSSDNITSQTSNLTISGGGGVAGNKLVLFDDRDNDGIIDSGEALATASLTAATWSADISLATGTHSIKAIQSDAAGNSSAASSALAIVIQSQPTNNTPTVTAFSKAGDEDAAISFIATNFAAKFNDPDSDALDKSKSPACPATVPCA